MREKKMDDMNESDVLDPGDLRCKAPCGAVRAGETVRLTLRPPRTMGFSRGEVTLRYEFDRDRTETIPMPWTDTDWVRDEFSCTVDTGDYVGLVWYSFRLTGFRGRELKTGEYQLTVYDGRDRVPGWFGKGMCYQILPDRFCRSRIPDPAGMMGNRWVHQNWDEAPAVGSLRRRRTTATARRITAALIPCWARTRTLSACAKRRTKWASAFCWTACSITPAG